MGTTQIREQLPNSGDALKLLVLSNNQKIVCGWLNVSCKVINQNIRDISLIAFKLEISLIKIIIRETVIGNRGSKAVIDTDAAITVKEQRVDGS